MTDTVPAGWYDDPEDPGRYRYWDGDRWTDHRAAKGTRTARRRSESAWALVGETFRLLSARWREFTVIGSVVAVTYGAAIGAALLAWDSFFGGRLGDVVEQVTDPGFDPESAEADRFFDSLDAGITSGFVAWVLVAAVVGVLGAVVTQAAVMRYTTAARAENRLGPAPALAGGLRRSPRVLLVGLAYGGAMALAVIIAVVVGIAAPLTFIVTGPALIGLLIWIIPMASMSVVAAAVGPDDPDPLPGGWRLATTRWRHVAVRIGVVWLIGIAIGAGSNIVVSMVGVWSLWGSLVVTIIANSFAVLVQGVMLTLVYFASAGTADPDLVHEAPAEITE